MSSDHSGALVPEPTGHSRRVHSTDGGSLRFDDPDGSRGATEDKPLVHKVGNPPRPSVTRQVLNTVKETMFPDDPFRQFKGQSKRRKWILGFQFVFPILEWAPNYKLNLLKGDIIAGLTIASLAVPQDLGYANLASLPKVNGLYSSFVPPLIYAVMGSSRDIAIGPVAVVSVLLGTLLRRELKPSDPNYIRLAFTATFFAGVVQAAMGFFRVGFIIDYLSHASVIGFMAGAAITIGLQQLKGYTGVSNFTTKTDIVSVLRSVFQNTHQWNWQTIVIATAFLAFLIFTKLLGKKKKNLFWIAALAPLFSLIIATACVYGTRADKHGVKIVGHIRKGVNPASASQIFFSGKYLGKGFTIGIVAGLVALTEAVAIARTFAALKDYHIDGNKEMLSIGLMNIIGSTTSCYVTTGSFSRSAVNYQSGCNTALTNIIMAIVVLFTLLFLTPLFKYTPNAILSSIIIAAVLNLIDIRAAIVIWKTDKFDFLAMLGAFFGVLFISVEYGLLIAVIISFLKILLEVTRPHTAVLGNIVGTNVYRNKHQYPDAVSEPGILIVRIDSSIYFANSNYIRERILRYVDDGQDKINLDGGVPIQFVLVELTPVQNVDTTSIHAFEELNNALKKRNIQITFANPGSGVIEKFENGGLVNLIGQEWFFVSVGEAVQVLSIIVKRNSHKLSEKNSNQV
ncbi:unnamed protein product [Calypogeia fissa]